MVIAEVSDMNALYWEALTSIDGLGSRTLLKLLSVAGSVEALWNASDAFLSAHLPEARRTAFCRRRDKGLDGQWLEIYQRLGIQAVSYSDAAYPKLLKEIHDPPMLLYIKGNVAALSGKTLAIVGTRKATEYGRQSTEKLVRELKPANACIVSGLAAGIDTFAHWAALQNQLLTVAVFGCGLDVVTPASNRRLAQEIILQGGALVSEYRLGSQPSKYSFPERNRIVAGISHGVLAIEGDIRSGALITAKLALEEGRSVFAVPGNIHSPGSQGPLHLIKNGAVPVSCGEDILLDLQWWIEYDCVKENTETNSEKTLFDNVLQGLSDEERQLLRSIPYDPISLDDLSHTSGLSFAKINELLTLLELEGLIVLLPGAKVCRR